MIPQKKVARLTRFPNEQEDNRSFEETVDFIEWLMIWYCKKPSSYLANMIVSHLESLKQRNANGQLVNSDWNCDRLLKNWEYIAEHCRHKA